MQDEDEKGAEIRWECHPDDVLAIAGGAVAARVLPFVPKRPWPDPVKYGHIRPDDDPGFSAMTPKGHVEFRGWGRDVGPWQHYQPLPYANGDVVHLVEEWSVDPALDGRPDEDVARWPVMRLLDGTVHGAADGHERVDGEMRAAATMPLDASRARLVVKSMMVRRLSRIPEDRIRKLGVDPERFSDYWSIRNPDGPAVAEDPLVIYVEFVLDGGAESRGDR